MRTHIDHTSKFIDDTKDVIRQIRIWGVNNKIFTLEGFDTAI
jgi:hypothetical protein